jgi:geranylgeranyl diphosphate synthase, type I
LSWLAEYAGPVNAEIRDLFPPPHQTSLEKAAAEALSVGGKRVRATLAMLWCEVFSGDSKQAVPLAVAYELAHASALVQDDILDNSPMRRGKESVVAKYGLSTAILASDLLLFNVPKMVAKYDYLDSKRLARIFDLVGEACRATTWGEYLDSEFARGVGGTEKGYEEMVRLKTSTLLSAPCSSGALVGGADEEQALVASQFGEELGMAYQIQDDTLDLLGDERALGKPVFTDLRGGKKSIILLHCVSRCSANDRRFISSLLNRDGPYEEEEISRLRRLIDEHGSAEYAREMVLRRTSNAKKLLEGLPQSRASKMLLSLSEYLSTRYY